MKKTIASVIVTAVAVVLCCMCMAACSSNVAGTYKFNSMKGEESGVKIELKVGDSFMGMITLTEDYMVLTLNEDNTLTLTVMGESVNGTWKQEDGKYYIVSGGEQTEFQVKGNTITMSEDGYEVVLKK